MTREEAIEILWQYDVNFEPHPAEKVMHALDMAIEALHREEAEEKGYCHRIKPKEYFSADAKWIPCSERLPKARESILIATSLQHDNWVGEGCYWETTKNHVIWKGYRWNATYWDNEVTAWMPLPKPYREDGEV